MVPLYLDSSREGREPVRAKLDTSRLTGGRSRHLMIKTEQTSPSTAKDPLAPQGSNCRTPTDSRRMPPFSSRLGAAGQSFRLRVCASWGQFHRLTRGLAFFPGPVSVVAEKDDGGAHKVQDGEKREVDEVHQELKKSRAHCKYHISPFNLPLKYCAVCLVKSVTSPCKAEKTDSDSSIQTRMMEAEAFYLGANVQGQASLVSKDQDDDALQDGAEKGVDPKHQGAQLLSER